MKKPLPARLFLITVFMLVVPITTKAYSVLTHEALIDASWKNNITPLLRLKYPNATDDDLKKAHAYAYGGCLLPDMGYFPFGSIYFTNLAHYVRSGDFVLSLISEARDINEYAFALGALCHYMADRYGHSMGTNRTVPIVYPGIGKKFGPIVTYEENRIAHSRVELSFDVLETAKGNYAPEAYHDFIGFEVAKPVLERAYLKTYGEDINEVFGDLDLAISTYRWSVKSLMPTITHAAWQLRKDEIKKQNPSANSRSFHFKMKRKAYNKEFGSSYRKPAFKDRVIAFFIRILPKVGPLKALSFKDPGPKGEEYFIKSFDTVLVHYRDALVQVQSNQLKLQDVDYDTGRPTRIGEYELADETYSTLLIRLEKTKFNNLTAPLKENILSFYNKADTVSLDKKHDKDRKKTIVALQGVRTANLIAADSLKTAKGINYKLNEPLPKATGSQ